MPAAATAGVLLRRLVVKSGLARGQRKGQGVGTSAVNCYRLNDNLASLKMGSADDMIAS